MEFRFGINPIWWGFNPISISIPSVIKCSVSPRIFFNSGGKGSGRGGVGGSLLQGSGRMPPGDFLVERLWEGDKKQPHLTPKCMKIKWCWHHIKYNWWEPVHCRDMSKRWLCAYGSESRHCSLCLLQIYDVTCFSDLIGIVWDLGNYNLSLRAVWTKLKVVSQAIAN